MEKLFLTVLGMSGTASLVILVVLLARLALRKAPKTFSYVLWAVVLFRLLCPFSVESSFSLAPKVQVKSREWDNNNMVTVDVSQREVTITIGDAPTTRPELPEGDALAVPGVPNLLQPDASVTDAPAAPEPWLIAGTVWLTGVGLLMGFSLLSLLRLRRKLVGSVPLAGEENVRLADHIPSPFVLGLARPQIYLPSDLPEHERDYVLLHERTHIRRFDHVTRALAWLALSVHWFNPLVWLAFHLAGKDMEMSCDEAVLRKMGREIRADYSFSLLRLSAGGRLPAGPLAFGGGDLQGRVKNILSYKKPALWVIGLALAAVVCAGVALATDFGGTRESFDAGLDDIPADLTFTVVLDVEGTENTFVRIEGSLDGIALDHAVWFPPSWYSRYDSMTYSQGRLIFDMPLCDGQVGCSLDAFWTDGSRTAVTVTATPRAILSSYHEPGNLVITVDLSKGTLLELDGYVPKLHADALELVPTEAEAMRTARVAAMLLTAAENYYQSQAGGPPHSPSDMIYDDTEALAAYRAVLSGNTTFHDTGTGKDLDIAHICEVFNPGMSLPISSIYFTTIDLDGDGTREAVLMMHSNIHFGYEILHYQDGTVYGYYVVTRGLEELKVDGTYSGSSSAFIGTVLRIESFSENGYHEEILAQYNYLMYDYDDENEIHEYFVVNGQKSSSAQVQTMLSQQDAKESAEWHDLTEENLELTLTPGPAISDLPENGSPVTAER